MSARNTGLFVRGHLAPERVARIIWAHPAIGPDDLEGDERPRVGHGTHHGLAYTHLGLRLFEVGGLLLLDSPDLPGPDELEQELGRQLSADDGVAVFLHYDEERGAGGHALFRDGVLVSRLVYDGRAYQPVRRDLDGQHDIQVADEEAWLWEDIGRAVEEGTRALFGPGLRTDDDLQALIQAADAQPVDAPADTRRSASADRAQPQPQGPSLRGLLRRIAGREG